MNYANWIGIRTICYCWESGIGYCNWKHEEPLLKYPFPFVQLPSYVAEIFSFYVWRVYFKHRTVLGQFQNFQQLGWLKKKSPYSKNYFKNHKWEVIGKKPNFSIIKLHHNTNTLICKKVSHKNLQKTFISKCLWIYCNKIQN